MLIRGNLPLGMMSRSRGVVVYRFFKDGRIVAAKWPRRRPGRLPMVTQHQVAIWDMVMEFIKQPAPREFANAIVLTHNTAFYTRDLLIMGCYGHSLGWPGVGIQP